MNRSKNRSRPNILLVTTDQQRPDTMSCAGHPCLYTPHLDQIADEGVRFQSAYSNCPVCIPARTTLITGREAHHNGIPSYSERSRIDRDRADYLGSLVTAAGYQTCLVGKTHWHTEPQFRAGFETVVWGHLMRKQMIQQLGQPISADGVGFNEITPHRSPRPAEFSNTGWLVERAVEFLQLRDRHQPFFLWVSIQDPHPPFSVHEPFYSMYDGADIPDPIVADWSSSEESTPRSHYLKQGHSKIGRMPSERLRKARSVYYGTISHIDQQLGRLIGTLMSRGDWDDTLMIYTTDHGEMLGDHGTRAKSSFLDASARIPFLVRPPGAWREDAEVVNALGSTSDALVGLEDILPTCCDAAGARVPDDVDGRSLLPLVRAGARTANGRERSHEPVRAFYHGHIDTNHMYRDADYKYLYFTDDGSELLFATDDTNDSDPLAIRTPGVSQGDESLLARYRELLLAHLREEDHADATDDGLRNDGAAKPSAQEVRAINSSGYGALGTNEYPLTR